MVTVVLQLQHLLHLVHTELHILSKLTDRFGKNSFQFLLRDTAKRFITLVHADVLRLVEAAEDTHLGELRHTRQHHEAQVSIRCLEGTIETFEDIAVIILQRDAVARLICK